MRDREKIVREIADATNEIGAIDAAVSRRLFLELLLDVRDLLSDVTMRHWGRTVSVPAGEKPR